MTSIHQTKHMKSLSIPFFRTLGTAALAVVCWLAIPQTLQAKDHGGQQQHFKGHGHNRASNEYLSVPSTRFSLTLGTGYAGRGYYYGPPNYGYYYQRPGVIYYATREAAPREYYGQSSYGGYSMGAAVQSALARRGYYRGYVDGQIGPQSRQSIANYQQDQGLRVTGNISPSLLRSLGL